jgi:hypothetical protein
MSLAIRRLDSRQGAKHAKFRSEKINYLEKIVYLLFSDLCGPFDFAQDMLGVFAGDIPSFSYGSAAPKRPPWLYTG